MIGINIGKSRVVGVEDAIDDYLASTRLLAPLADYLVVNVSSPDTPGLRGLQEIDRLEPLLVAVLGAAGRFRFWSRLPRTSRMTRSRRSRSLP